MPLFKFENFPDHNVSRCVSRNIKRDIESQSRNRSALQAGRKVLPVLFCLTGMLAIHSVQAMPPSVGGVPAAGPSAAAGLTAAALPVPVALAPTAPAAPIVIQGNGGRVEIAGADSVAIIGRIDVGQAGDPLAGHSARALAASSHSASAYPAGAHSASSYSESSHPAGAYSASSHPAGAYSASSHPAGAYSASSHPAGAYSTSAFPESRHSAAAAGSRAHSSAASALPAYALQDDADQDDIFAERPPGQPSGSENRRRETPSGMTSYDWFERLPLVHVDGATPVVALPANAHPVHHDQQDFSDLDQRFARIMEYMEEFAPRQRIPTLREMRQLDPAHHRNLYDGPTGGLLYGAGLERQLRPSLDLNSVYWF